MFHRTKFKSLVVTDFDELIVMFQKHVTQHNVTKNHFLRHISNNCYKTNINLKYKNKLKYKNLKNKKHLKYKTNLHANFHKQRVFKLFNTSMSHTSLNLFVKLSIGFCSKSSHINSNAVFKISLIVLGLWL